MPAQGCCTGAGASWPETTRDGLCSSLERLLCGGRSVAPVEVARAAPQALVCAGDRVERVLTRPGMRHLGDLDGRFGSVHRLLETSLLLGLEERVIVERILRLVARDRHVVLEVGVLALELEVFLNDLAEDRRCLDRHTNLRVRGHVFEADCNGIMKYATVESTDHSGRTRLFGTLQVCQNCQKHQGRSDLR